MLDDLIGRSITANEDLFNKDDLGNNIGNPIITKGKKYKVATTIFYALHRYRGNLSLSCDLL